MKIDTLMTVLRQLADRKLYPRKIRLSPASMRELADDGETLGRFTFLESLR